MCISMFCGFGHFRVSQEKCWSRNFCRLHQASLGVNWEVPLSAVATTSVVATFPGESGSSFPPRSFSVTCYGRELLGLVEHGFMGQMSFLPPDPQCQSTEDNTQSTNPNQWSDLILSSSAAVLLTEGALHPLHWLTNPDITSDQWIEWMKLQVHWLRRFFLFHRSWRLDWRPYDRQQVYLYAAWCELKQYFPLSRTPHNKWLLSIVDSSILCLIWFVVLRVKFRPFIAQRVQQTFDVSYHIFIR